VVGKRLAVPAMLLCAVLGLVAWFVLFANDYLQFEFGHVGETGGKAIDLLFSASNDLSTYCAGVAAGCVAFLLQQRRLAPRPAVLIFLAFLLAAAGVFVGLLIKVGAAVPLSRGLVLIGTETAFWKGVSLQIHLLAASMVSAALVLAGRVSALTTTKEVDE
jgi:hypothetical protein